MQELKRTYPETKVIGANIDEMSDDFEVNYIAVKAGEDAHRSAKYTAGKAMGTDVELPQGGINPHIDGLNNQASMELYTFKGENKITESTWDGDDNLLDAIEDYTHDPMEEIANGGRHYDAVIDSQRGGNAKAHDIDKLWEYEPNFDGAVYRGTRLREDQVALFDSLEEGQVLGSKAMMSASFEPKVASEFTPSRKHVEINRIDKELGNASRPTEGMVVTIRTKNGYNISEHSTVSDEAEVLLKPGSSYSIISKDIVGEMRHLLLEEIDPRIVDIIKDSSHGKNFNPNNDILGALGLTAVGVGATESKADTSNTSKIQQGINKFLEGK